MDHGEKKVIKILSVGTIDAAVALVPGLNVAWVVSKALYGAGIVLRKDRALEWVNFIRDNARVFTHIILSDQSFQDGFVFMLEQYLRERSETRRLCMKSIFLGFVAATDKINFPLEKYTFTLSQLSEEDIVTMKDVKIDAVGSNYQIYGNEATRIENIFNLIHAGLLLQDHQSRFGPVNSPFVNVSEFGRKFVEYLFA